MTSETDASFKRFANFLSPNRNWCAPWKILNELTSVMPRHTWKLTSVSPKINKTIQTLSYFTLKAFINIFL